MKLAKKLIRSAIAITLLGFTGAGYAIPLIDLPVGEIARMSYAGQELFRDANANGRPDIGDVFEGVVAITQITGAGSGADFSGQLVNKEITSHFRFTITDHSANFLHLEFGLLASDFFNFFVGQGTTKNFDPSMPDAYSRSEDGQFWLGIQPGPFFESVNDRQANGSTLNRAWTDVAVNDTGFVLESGFLRTLLGSDAQHTYQGQAHDDHSVQAIFDNRVSGLSPFSPNFTFSIFGELDILAVAEPPAWLLFLLGGFVLALFWKAQAIGNLFVRRPIKASWTR